MKRLKHQLWDTMEPILLSKQASDSSQPLTACELLHGMYYVDKSLDPTNISVQSSFICMLHLANEQGLEFLQDDRFGVSPEEMTKAEADFTI